MLNFDDLQRAGHSVTKRAWYTNPVRRAVLAIARPYFMRILAELAEKEKTGAQAGPALREELLRLNRMLDGLRKDQMAVNHRLASLDDDVEALRRPG